MTVYYMLFVSYCQCVMCAYMHDDVSECRTCICDMCLSTYLFELICFSCVARRQCGGVFEPISVSLTVKARMIELIMVSKHPFK